MSLLSFFFVFFFEVLLEVTHTKLRFIQPQAMRLEWTERFWHANRALWRFIQEISALYSVSALYVTRTALYEESTSRVTTKRELRE